MIQATPVAEGATLRGAAKRSADTCAAALPELLPARMLNEFTYCPRLGYLEWVQGEWAENLETLQGSFGHRNVDKASRGEVPEAGQGARAKGQVKQPPADSALDSQPSTPDSSTIHARSLMLSAPVEG